MTCSHFAGVERIHAVCHFDGVHVQASPATGCVFWQREVGTDDEGDSPDLWEQRLRDGLVATAEQWAKLRPAPARRTAVDG